LGITVFLARRTQTIEQHAYSTAWPGNIYFGAVVPNLYGGNLSVLSAFEQEAHKSVSIVLNYYSWNVDSSGNGVSLDVGLEENST